MKRIITFVISILFMTSIFAATINGKVESVKNKVQFSKDNIEWTLVNKDTILDESDIIQTGFNSSVTFIFDDVTIKLGSLSRVVVKKAVLDKERMNGIFELKKGRASVSLNTTHKEKNSLEIDTKDVIVEVTGTKFDINERGVVNVYEGVVDVFKADNFHKLSSSSRPVKAGEQFFNGVVNPQAPKPQPQYNKREEPNGPRPLNSSPRKDDNPGNNTSRQGQMPAVPPKSKNDRR